MIGFGYMAFKFSTYDSHYLGAIACRFNRRFNLQELLRDLIGNAAVASPTRAPASRGG